VAWHGVAWSGGARATQQQHHRRQPLTTTATTTTTTPQPSCCSSKTTTTTNCDCRHVDSLIALLKARYPGGTKWFEKDYAGIAADLYDFRIELMNAKLVFALWDSVRSVRACTSVGVRWFAVPCRPPCTSAHRPYFACCGVPCRVVPLSSRSPLDVSALSVPARCLL
jgi:hypothetical protein